MQENRKEKEAQRKENKALKMGECYFGLAEHE